MLSVAAVIALTPACGESDDDDVPLHLTFAKPKGGDVDVPLQPVIYIRFDRPLDPATVNDTNFNLTGSGGNIPITVTWHPYLNEVRMVPVAALTPSTVYQVTLWYTITAADRSTYVGSYYHFTTTSNTDADRPSFGGAAGAGSPTQTTIALTWTQGNDQTSGPNSLTYDVFVSTASGCYDFTAPYVSVTNPTGTTVQQLTAGTTYYFVVRARDPYGNTDLNEVEANATTLD